MTGLWQYKLEKTCQRTNNEKSITHIQHIREKKQSLKKAMKEKEKHWLDNYVNAIMKLNQI
jgi:hypothetical protein